MQRIILLITLLGLGVSISTASAATPALPDPSATSCAASVLTLTSVNNFYVYTPPLLGKRYRAKTTLVSKTSFNPNHVIIEDITLKIFVGTPQKIPALDGITVTVLKTFPNKHLKLRIEACPKPAAPLLSGSGSHSCSTATGDVHCWGSNMAGELGNGTVNNASGVKSATTPPLTNVISLSAGFGGHSCAVTASGTGKLYCWGSGLLVKGGDGMWMTITPTPTVVETVGPTAILNVAVGGTHICAQHQAGDVYCWGQNTYGELGQGTTSTGTEKPTVPVVGLDDVVSVAAGYRHSCALTVSGTVWCWGENEHGQLGNGEAGKGIVSSTPVQVIGLPAASELVAAYDHTCAISAGDVWCWGENAAGVLGSGSISPFEASPQKVKNLMGAKTIATGSQHTCAVSQNGDVTCWGNNWACALGIGIKGGEYSEPQTVTVNAVKGAVRLSAGEKHTCAVLQDNITVTCWGNNTWGELGVGAIPSAWYLPDLSQPEVDENGVPYHVCGEPPS